VVDNERAEGLLGHEDGPRLPCLVALPGGPGEEGGDLVEGQGEASAAARSE
jgi:hypothetical protein